MKPLTREAEAHLVAAARLGDRPALASLLSHLDRLIIAQARRYRGLGVEVADLAQEGRIRVVQCLAGFDPARGVRFATYACQAVRRRCYEVTLDAGATVRVGRGEQRRAWREGGDGEVRLRKARRAVSGDADKGKQPSLFDRLPSPAVGAPDALQREQDAAALRRAVGALGPQQRAVVMALWLDDEDAPNKAAVGRASGVTRARVWQVEQAALARLRLALQAAE